MSDVSVITPMSEESHPSNPTVRDAAKFAHWLRKELDRDRYLPGPEGRADTEGLVHWWQRYGGHGRERFQRTLALAARLHQITVDERYQEWTARSNLTYNKLTEKRVNGEITYSQFVQRRNAWVRRNPEPRYTGNDLSIHFCSECDEPRFHYVDWYGGGLCQRCFVEHFRFCDRCRQTYRNTEDHYHPPPPRHGSKCIAKHERFRMPNVLVASGYQPCDRIVHVQGQAVGMVPDTAFEQIAQAVRDSLGFDGRFQYWQGADCRELVAANWETREGKLSKRLANKLYKTYGYKLPTELVTQIGNIARQNMSTALDYQVEFTRKLDRSASDFANPDSCWWTGWGDNNRMRCILKANGGFAMRTFYRARARMVPQGRCWVIPLDDTLTATHDTMSAHAYLLFNAYVESGQTMSSLLAAMTGKKYVSYFQGDFAENTGMFINSGSMYLVADKMYDRDTVKVHMLVNNGTIQCSCVTHRDDEVEPYTEDDSDFDSTILNMMSLVPDEPDGEAEEPFDDQF